MYTAKLIELKAAVLNLPPKSWGKPITVRVTHLPQWILIHFTSSICRDDAAVCIKQN
jgi:hypothetical protein